VPILAGERLIFGVHSLGTLGGGWLFYTVSQETILGVDKVGCMMQKSPPARG
jgi:hypothetical protein